MIVLQHDRVIVMLRSQSDWRFREEKICEPFRHCEEPGDEAIQSRHVDLDCVAEAVIGRALARPVGPQ
jgi:hypothetical protein